MKARFYFIISGTIFFVMALLSVRNILYLMSSFESLGNILIYASFFMRFLIPFSLGIWAYWLYFKPDREQ